MRKFATRLIALISLMMCVLCTSSYAGDYDDYYKDPFTFTSGHTTFKFGGNISFVMGRYTQNNIPEEMGFVISDLAMEEDPYNTDPYFILEASNSNMYMDVTQSTDVFGDIQFYASINFRGDNSTARLRMIYVKLKGFSLGQDWSYFTDIRANAPTIDNKNVPARVSVRMPQLAYQHRFTKTVTAGVSLEKPSVSMDIDDDSTEASQSIPDIAYFVQAQGSLGHIKLAGVWRTMIYSNFAKGHSETTNGWGIKLSGSLKPSHSPVTIYSQALYGLGISRYMSGLTSLDIDVVESYTGSGEMASLYSYGGVLGLRWDLSNKIAFASNYSQAFVEEREGFTYDDLFHKSEYLSTTLFYYPAEKFTFGVEYLYGRKFNFDGANASAQRANMLFRYSF